MTDLMRKILYYEKILEFKEKTQSALLQSEVNNLNLCRTCLNDAAATESFELSESGSGLCVMGLDGQLLQTKEMLSVATDIKISPTDRLPMKICKDCLKKLTSLYFFRIQTRRAEEVLKRILEKLDGDEVEEPSTSAILEQSFDITINEADCSSSSQIKPTSVQPTPPANQDEYPHIEATTEPRLMPKLEQYDDADKASDDHLNETNVNAEFLELNALLYEDEEKSMESQSNDKEAEQEITTQEVDEVQDEEEHYSLAIETNEIYFGEEKAAEEDVELDVQLTSTDIDSSCPQPQRKRCKGGKTLLDNLACVLCDKTFPLQRMLIAHVQVAHPYSKAFKCRHCTQMFSHLQSLSRHMQTHQPKKYRKDCNICDKSFLRSDDWRRHQRTHTGERPHVCNVCRKAFKQACELKEHSNTHSKQRRFICSICGHSLQSRNGLYIHKKVHEGIKQHKCTECQKRFITRGELKSHLNVHNKSK